MINCQDIIKLAQEHKPLYQVNGFQIYVTNMNMNSDTVILGEHVYDVTLQYVGQGHRFHDLINYLPECVQWLYENLAIHNNSLTVTEDFRSSPSLYINLRLTE